MRLLISAFLLFQIGCATTVIQRGPPSEMQTSPVSLTHNIAMWGLWEVSDPVRPDLICGDREWSSVTTRFPAKSIVFGVITAGIYTPAEVTVTCADHQSAR